MTQRTGTVEEIQGWFAGRLPNDWFVGTPEVLTDRDEILVVGTLSDPELPADASAETAATARSARVEGFREDTRERRMAIAREAQHRFGRHVSWGAQSGDIRMLFTTVSAPAMTRLRMRERQVLDTLVDAGVARSRSHALAWCVGLVAERQDDWLSDLRDALTHVEKVREKGPSD
jgi:hypothetical protein